MEEDWTYVVVSSIFVIAVSTVAIITYGDLSTLPDQNGDGIFSVSDVRLAALEAYSMPREWLLMMIPDEVLRFFELEPDDLAPADHWRGFLESTLVWGLLGWLAFWASAFVTGSVVGIYNFFRQGDGMDRAVGGGLVAFALLIIAMLLSAS